jgi:hypothetical protein
MLCTLEPEEAEASSRIFNEIKSEFPNGLGSVKVIGPDLMLYIPRLRELRGVEPTIHSQFMEFPFTGSGLRGTFSGQAPIVKEFLERKELRPGVPGKP